MEETTKSLENLDINEKRGKKYSQQSKWKETRQNHQRFQEESPRIRSENQGKLKWRKNYQSNKQTLRSLNSSSRSLSSSLHSVDSLHSFDSQNNSRGSCQGEIPEKIGRREKYQPHNHRLRSLSSSSRSLSSSIFSVGDLCSNDSQMVSRRNSQQQERFIGSKKYQRYDQRPRSPRFSQRSSSSLVSDYLTLNEPENLPNSLKNMHREASGVNRELKTHRSDTFSISYIKNISRLSSNCLIKTLNSQIEEFSNFFNLPIKKDNIIPVLQFIMKLCNIEYEFSKKELLQVILNSSEFVRSISIFIDCIEECSRTVSETERNARIIIMFYKESVNYIPNEKIVDFNDLLLKTIHVLNNIGNFPLEIIKSVELYRSQLSKRCSLIDTKKISYKTLSVFPTKNDLLEEPILRPNVSTGPYNTVEDYIDIQFKLLKEDFVSGLRSGINQYTTQLKERTKQRNQDIFVYHKVIYKGLSEHVNPAKKLTHIFELDKKPLNKVQWEVSKRLIHGSLLLFSNDDFQTYFMATFDERDVFSPDATGWNISVVLIGKPKKLRRFSEFVMIEPRVFFEPYYHVLNALKTIHPQNFPLERYIIHIETSPQMPHYLTENTRYIISDIEIKVNDINSWPDPEDIGVNQSQLEALQAALTRELVVIQGPPGTGKTYLGIKLINILLDNKEQWSDGKSSIFIACYRNQAVDQILEAVAIKNRSVVRLGGRSNSDILKDNTLKNTVGHLRDPTMYIRLDDLKSEIVIIKQKINELEQIKKFVTEKQGILNLEVFGKIMAPEHLKYLSAQNSYEQWLLDGEEEEPFSELDESGGFLNNPIINKAKKLSLPKNHPFIFLSVKHLLDELNDLDYEFETCFNLSEMQRLGQTVRSPEEIAVITQLLTYYNEKLCLLRKVLNRLNMKESETPLLKLKDSNLAALTVQERWTLYKYWGKELVNLCENNLDILIEEHNIKLLDFLQKKDSNDGENIRRARVDVIGATTTGAARLQKLLSVAKPKIVIIEEAAEVLEAHTIASLTESCEHLILIGDHKQLKPNPASHVSTVKYNLDLSLFERMIKNGMECFTLSEQHRMRPEISSLVVPQIYPTLSNHPSVEEYPDIKGVKKNLFFLGHSVSEDQLRDNDSHQNKFEAYFTLALADYIIKQGYEANSITILTVYGAQLVYLKSIKKNYPNIEDVEIQVVDNFQGEENDIILLSLVRSNSSTIGFLSKENRVCVALTRAKKGFFIIGNMETLQINSSVWKQIKRTLEDRSSVGEFLPLRCETHKRITKVKTSEDFIPLVYGGCSSECGMNLDCGHTCTFLCHPVDRDHSVHYTCQKECLKKRNCGIHKCMDKCGNECPPCNIKLPKKLHCSHEGFMICAGDDLPCEVNCPKTLDCGHLCSKHCHFGNDNHAECSAICNKPNKSCPFHHLCTKICGEDCGECLFDTLIELNCGHIAKGICNEVRDIKCEVQVEKDLDCGHVISAPCSLSIDEIICIEKMKFTLPCSHEVIAPCQIKKEDIICDALVEKVLPCGHKYKDAPCRSNLDELICNEEVPKSLMCGHDVKVPCFSTKFAIQCPFPCNQTLSCGHECMGTCGQDCPACKVGVEITETCGHVRVIACSAAVNGSTRAADDIGPDKCAVICNETLACGHTCKGTCDECMQGRLHVICNAVCNKRLICSHSCENKCWNDFHSCKNNCLNACKHRECSRKCGEICTKCMEPCDWECIHYQCSMKCWQICDRPPCEFPCKKTMDCGHPCFGYCGEPCPPLCLVCTQNFSEDINERFILLEDCDHVISNVEAADLLAASEGLIVCPNCSTTIIKTNFFREHNRRFFSKYSKVKKKALETDNTRRTILGDFRKNFKLLNIVLKTKYEGCKSLNLLLQNLITRTAPIMKNEQFKESKLSLKSLLFICFYVTEALKMTKVEDLNEERSSKLLRRIDHLAAYLFSRRNQISISEMHLFFKELDRLRFIIDLFQLEQDKNFIPSEAKNTEFYIAAQTSAYSLKQFSSDEKMTLVKCLQKLKQYLSSNYLLLSTTYNDFQKIFSFFNKYYQITFHAQNWHKCNKNHFFYSDSYNENIICPLCSNNQGTFLFFSN